MSFLHPFQGPLRLAPQSFTYNLKLRDWRRIEVENFDAFIYFTWFLDFSLFPSFYKFPNIYGVLIDNFAGSFASATKGAFSYKVTGAQNLGFNANTGSGGYFEFEFFASRNNSMYGSSLTNQPAALRSLVLVRAY